MTQSQKWRQLDKSRPIKLPIGQTIRRLQIIDKYTYSFPVAIPCRAAPTSFYFFFCSMLFLPSSHFVLLSNWVFAVWVGTSKHIQSPKLKPVVDRHYCDWVYQQQAEAELCHGSHHHATYVRRHGDAMRGVRRVVSSRWPLASLHVRKSSSMHRV